MTTVRLFVFLLFFWLIAVLAFFWSLESPALASAPKKKPGTRVMAIEHKEPEPKKGCLPPIRVVGSQDIREDAAEESAKKAWAEQVRWSHGESYQDINNAIAYAKRCSRSSIGEALGQYFSRCEVEAAPCREPFTSVKSGE